MYYPFETQVTPLTNVRRERRLPAPGDILVHVGEHVDAIQVIARASLPGEFHILPVARLLEVPVSRVERYLRVRLGDEVRQGQVIAAKRGLGSRTVRSPISGTLTASGGGRVLIEAQPSVFELRAYIPGTVSSITANTGVIVETMGCVIQGTWGTGGENFGVLGCLVKSPDKPLRPKDIDPACHGMIIVGSIGLNEAVIERAQELQIRGIVTGGFPPELVSLAREVSFPIVATEGIGTVPMSDAHFRLLSTNDGREASISGQVRSRWGVVRPEIVIPLPAEAPPAHQSQPGTRLTVGARVRVVRAPYMGQVGIVTALPAHVHRTDTGIRTRVAEVNLSQGTRAFIPLVNLEVLR